jgi:hypothetical protein
VKSRSSCRLRTLLPSMLSGTSHARLRQAEILRTEMHAIKAGPIAHLYCSARTSFCAPSGLARGGRRSSMSVSGTFEKCRRLRRMSAFRGKAEGTRTSLNRRFLTPELTFARANARNFRSTRGVVWHHAILVLITDSSPIRCFRGRSAGLATRNTLSTTLPHSGKGCCSIWGMLAGRRNVRAGFIGE